MREYKHVVQYYETDKMGITHHSNYIRWMEEARIDFLQQIGWDYAKLEETGVISPVVKVECDYKKTSTFSDEISIQVSVTEYKGIKLVLQYEMKNKCNEIICEASSTHCFMDRDNRIIRMAKQLPEFHKVLTDLAQRCDGT